MYIRLRRFVWPSLLIAATCDARGQAVNETVAAVRRRLLQAYGDPTIRPGEAAAALSGGETCHTAIPPEDVEVQLYIESYLPIDSREQTWGFVSFLRVWWTDVRLAYNGTADGGCTDELHLTPSSLDSIWTPAFYWENMREVKRPEAGKRTRGELVHVYPGGRIWWSSQIEFLITCSMVQHLGSLPYDKQRCNFLMGMYSDSDAHVRVRWRGHDDSDPSAALTALVNWDGACMAEFHAFDMTQELVTRSYEKSTYTYASVDVHFVRNPAVWLQTYMLPACLLVALSYMGFYLPQRGAIPARIALGMTSVLIVIINLQSLLRVLPQTTEQPWLCRFLMNCLFFNVAAIIEQTLVCWGVSISDWCDAQKKKLHANVNWRRLLYNKRGELPGLLKEEFDPDGDGSIDKNQFRAAMAWIGLEVDPKEINEFFDEMDGDGNGAIAFDELEALIEKVLGTRVNAKENRSNSIDSRTATMVSPVGDGGGSCEKEDLDLQAPAASLHRMVEQPPTSWHMSMASASHVQGAAMDCPQPVEQQQASPTRAETAESEPARNAGPSRRSARRHMRDIKRTEYTKHMTRDLGNGIIWHFEYYTLFPPLRFVLLSLDVCSRFVFPAAFLIFAFMAFYEVDFGREQQRLLEAVPCYRRQSRMAPLDTA